MHITYLGEDGQDVGKIIKDLLTHGWKEILKEYFQVEETVIPYVPLHKKAASMASFSNCLLEKLAFSHWEM